MGGWSVMCFIFVLFFKAKIYRVQMLTEFTFDYLNYTPAITGLILKLLALIVSNVMIFWHILQNIGTVSPLIKDPTHYPFPQIDWASSSQKLQIYLIIAFFVWYQAFLYYSVVYLVKASTSAYYFGESSPTWLAFKALLCNHMGSVSLAAMIFPITAALNATLGTVLSWVSTKSK
jgi:hypothetical protein